MKFRNPTISIITVSLIAAIAIIAASAFLGESAQMATYFIIAIWWIPFSFLAVRTARKNSKNEPSE